ncbi:hypothetical protein HMI54_013775 [Coelomomyces lativittatus]|nr:hypothetical protein HMI54_013775 [Coelomomyces lativittatus]KAJ1497419.1 hypothetical protein HMI56_005629 [Coelomomyces lativittatus]
MQEEKTLLNEKSTVSKNLNSIEKTILKPNPTSSFNTLTDRLYTHASENTPPTFQLASTSLTLPKPLASIKREEKNYSTLSFQPFSTYIPPSLLNSTLSTHLPTLNTNEPPPSSPLIHRSSLLSRTPSSLKRLHGPAIGSIPPLLPTSPLPAILPSTPVHPTHHPISKKTKFHPSSTTTTTTTTTTPLSGFDVELRAISKSSKTPFDFIQEIQKAHGLRKKEFAYLKPRAKDPVAFNPYDLIISDYELVNKNDFYTISEEVCQNFFLKKIK